MQYCACIVLLFQCRVWHHNLQFNLPVSFSLQIAFCSWFKFHWYSFHSILTQLTTSTIWRAIAMTLKLNLNLNLNFAIARQSRSRSAADHIYIICALQLDMKQIQKSIPGPNFNIMMTLSFKLRWHCHNRTWPKSNRRPEDLQSSALPLSYRFTCWKLIQMMNHYQIYANSKDSQLEI